MRKIFVGIGLLICLLVIRNTLDVNATPAANVKQDNRDIYLPLILNDYPIRTIFGIEMKSITPSGGIDKVINAKATWVRRNGVLWSVVEPTKGARDWSALSSLEAELINASAANLKVILIVRSTPQWAQKVPGYYCGPIKASELNSFALFMRDLVQRYGGPPYNVKYWEIWNEPDVDPSLSLPEGVYGCWGDKNDPYYGGGYYAEMLKVVYPQIKTADPYSQVLIGGLLLDCEPENPPAGKNCAPAQFLEGVLLNNGGNFFDGVSFHAYDYYAGAPGQFSNPNWSSAWNTTGPVVLAKANFIQARLNQYGLSGKALMNTEGALICISCIPDASFENTKAYYVPQIYAASLAENLQANIWYSLSGWRNSGLLASNGSPLPAYNAFVFAREELRNAVFSQALNIPGVKGYEFLRDSRMIWVVWSLDGFAKQITLPETPDAVFDTFGNSETPSILLNVDLMPRYVEFSP